MHIAYILAQAASGNGDIGSLIGGAVSAIWAFVSNIWILLLIVLFIIPVLQRNASQPGAGRHADEDLP